MIKTSFYSILLATTLSFSMLVGMESNFINHDQFLERETLLEMGFSQQGIDRIFQAGCTLETVQQLLCLDMSVDDIIDQLGETVPHDDVVTQNYSNDLDKKNELIEEEEEEIKNEEHIKTESSVIEKLHEKGYPMGTINWWLDAGYNLDLILQMLNNGTPLQKILSILEEEDDDENKEIKKYKKDLPPFTRTDSHPSPLLNKVQFLPVGTVKLKRSNCRAQQDELIGDAWAKITFNELMQEQSDEIDNFSSLTTSSDDDNEENIIIIEYNNQNPQVPTANQESKIVNTLSDFEGNRLASSIRQCKDAYENAIKPSLETMQFELNHITTFLVFSEEMVFYLLDKSKITNERYQDEFGFRLVEAMINFYSEEIKQIKTTFEKVHPQLNLEKILSEKICLSEEIELFKKIVSEHVDKTFSRFQQTLMNLNLVKQTIQPKQPSLKKLYPLLLVTISQAMQLKFECAKILQSYDSQDLVGPATQQIGTLGNTLKWMVKNLLRHTFYDNDMEEQCLSVLNEKMITFKSQKYSSFEELEEKIIDLQSSLNEMMGAWLQFSQDLIAAPTYDFEQF